MSEKIDYWNLQFVDNNPFFKNLTQRQIKLLNFCYYSYKKFSLMENFSFNFILENKENIIRKIEDWNVKFDFAEEEFEKGYNNHLNTSPRDLIFYSVIWGDYEAKAYYLTAREQIFISLIKHLFCRYTIPSELNFCWFFKNKIERNLCKILFFKFANGESIYKSLKNKEIFYIDDEKYFQLPELTRNQCFLFSKFLDNDKYYISLLDENFLTQILLATLAEDKVNQKKTLQSEKLQKSRGLYSDFERDLFNDLKKSSFNNNFIYSSKIFWNFIKNVVEWFRKIRKEFELIDAQLPELKEENGYYSIFPFTKSLTIKLKHQISPILDYFSHKLKNNPNYSLDGRTFDSVIKTMEQWHKQLKKEQYEKYENGWNGLNIPNFEREHERGILTITQILTKEELYEEGKELQHCVLNYIDKIIKESTSVFSLKNNGKRIATIEISSDKIIKQIKGFKNSEVIEFQKEIMEWVALFEKDKLGF